MQENLYRHEAKRRREITESNHEGIQIVLAIVLIIVCLLSVGFMFYYIGNNPNEISHKK